MRFLDAVVRPPGATFASGLTTVDLGVADYEIALAQHARYCEALSACGLAINVLHADDRHPDATFVEDTAVIVEKRVMITRPGHPSREGEVAPVRERLSAYFGQIDTIEAPGTVDGGDVCEAGDTVYIGVSHRTNETGARQLGDWLEKLGKRAVLVDIRAIDSILHLKSGMSYLEDGRFVAIDELLAPLALPDSAVERVDPAEAYAANCVRVNDSVLFPTGYPRLQERLSARGYSLALLDVSEYRKMDGGLSCLSLRF